MLIQDDTGAEIKAGDTVHTFRGEKGTVSLLRPDQGMNGRVYVRMEGDEYDSEFFPGVIGAHFA